MVDEATATTVTTATQWVNSIGVVGVLIAVIWYFYKRDQRNDRLLADATKKCEEREKRLEEKYDKLETHMQEHIKQQHEETSGMLQNCMRIMDTNSKTFEQLTKNDTDRFRALDEKRLS
jgi:hypothetical protein